MGQSVPGGHYRHYTGRTVACPESPGTDLQDWDQNTNLACTWDFSSSGVTAFVFLSAQTHPPAPGAPELPWATQRVLGAQKAQRALLGSAVEPGCPRGSICTL